MSDTTAAPAAPGPMFVPAAQAGGDTPEWNNYQPDRYDELLAASVAATRQRFAAYLSPAAADDDAASSSDIPLDVYPSPPKHFRLRAKFLATGTEGEEYASDDDGEVADGERPPVRHAGWNRGQAHPVDEYPIASTTVCDAMPRVVAYVSRHRALRNRLTGIQYLSTLSGDLLVTLVYQRRGLGDVFVKRAEALRAHLGAGVAVVATSKGVQRLIGGRNYVSETLTGPDGSPLHYRQIAGNFSNPNGRMAEHTLRWLAMCFEKELEGRATDLLELYCGCGNHTVAMAKSFRRVLGVEINRKLVAAAHLNLLQNKAANSFVLRAPSEDFCSRMLRHSTWKVKFKDYKKGSAPPSTEVPGIDAFLESQAAGMSEAEAKAGEFDFDFGAVVVDPPRAGLDEVTCKLVARYPHIAYISCNPEALARDIEALSTTHRVVRMAVFDHFPYTGHLECGALLSKKEKRGTKRPREEEEEVKGGDKDADAKAKAAKEVKPEA